VTQLSSARQVAGFIARFDPGIARLTRAARAALRKKWPTAVELVYDNYNALALGWGPNERASEAFVSIAVYPTGVSLYFIQGRRLPDPKRLLQGEGNRGAFIRLESAAQLGTPDVVALLRAAVALGPTPLPRTGRGYTIVKSISAKQRPRRPVKA
jgi:hypothetical protein